MRVCVFDCWRAVVLGGHWARLGLLERGVYGVLMQAADFDSRRVELAMTTIAQRAGITNVHRARLACQSLEDLGLVRTITFGGGRYGTAVRELVAPPPVPSSLGSDLFSATETGTVSGPVLGKRNRDAGRAETGTVAHRNRDGGRAETGTPHVPQSHLSHQITPPPQQTGTPSVPVSLTPPGGWKCKEEEEFFGLMVRRNIFPESAIVLVRQIAPSQAESIWKAVVLDKSIKDRGKVWWRRMRNYVKAARGEASE